MTIENTADSGKCWALGQCELPEGHGGSCWSPLTGVRTPWENETMAKTEISYRRCGPRYEVLMPFGIGQRRVGAVEKSATSAEWIAYAVDGSEVGVAGSRSAAALILTRRAS